MDLRSSIHPKIEILQRTIQWLLLYNLGSIRVLYFHFPTSMSCCVNHSGFLISTKDRYFLKCNSRNILIKLLLEWFSGFREKWFKIFPVRTIDEKWSHNSHQPRMPGELINNDRTRFTMMKWIYDMHNERNKQSNLVISK